MGSTNVSAQSESNSQLEVYYDGLCPVCAREIDMYRRWDKDGKIEFIDISAPEFSAEDLGLDPQRVLEVFHVRPKGKDFVTGVDGFVLIWQQLNCFSLLSQLAKNPLTRPIFDLGYFAFTKVRPYLRREACEAGVCAK